MISDVEDSVPTSSSRNWRGVRCGARRLSSVGARKVFNVNVRIMSFFANMISTINGVRRDERRSGQRLPSGKEAARRGIRRALFIYWANPVQGTARGKDGSARAIGIRDSGCEAASGLMGCFSGWTPHTPEVGPAIRRDFIHQSSAHTQRRNDLCTKREWRGGAIAER